MKQLTIGDRVLSAESIPYIIAEAGVNYYDIAIKHRIEPIEAAKGMISEAARAGADAIKFQTYKAEKLASKNSPAYWDTAKEDTATQYDLFKKYDKFDEDEYRELAKHAECNRIVFLSTPFDFESVDFLYELMPAYKISSSDITNLPFIEYIARQQKPIILSVGASTIEEIQTATQSIEESGNAEIALLHCILNYPTHYEDANLGMISHLKACFPNYLIGYSDHTVPDSNMLVLTTAFLLGAKIIEKHFTLDKTLKGNDHYHSMDPLDLKEFVSNIQLLNQIIGKEEKEPLPSEENSRKYARRSIVARVDIPKGAKITADMLTFKRPGTGIPPSKIDKIIGGIALCDMQEDEILQIENIRCKLKGSGNSPA